jgi:citrate lyase subunit beta / citryl-CoA lyase
MIANTGNKGASVRSDCYVALELASKGGLDIKLKSKVQILYGKSIISLCREILTFFEIKHAKLEIEDQGALPFTIAARLESAIKMLAQYDKEFLLPLVPNKVQRLVRDRQRRSRLYLPGNNPKLMINAGIYGADAIILDLEDSVAPERKNEARFLVRNALRAIDFKGAERMVRINQLPEGLTDLKFVVPNGVDLILVPKCESANQLKEVEQNIVSIAGTKEHNILLMPIIESSLGVANAYEIASASKSIVAMTIGLEDYTADIGVQRTINGDESFYARSVVVNAARSVGIRPIDSVFSDVGNIDLLADTIKRSKSLGFVGMGCIHPRQIPVIHQYFAPDENEINKAMQVVLAFEAARQRGSGVVALGSKMIDPPVVKRAVDTIRQAEELGVLTKDWRDNYEQ